MGIVQNLKKILWFPFTSLKILIPAILIILVVFINATLFYKEKKDAKERIKVEATFALSEKVNLLQSILEYSYRYELPDLAQSSLGSLSVQPYIKHAVLTDVKGKIIASSQNSLIGHDINTVLDQVSNNGKGKVLIGMDVVRNELRTKIIELPKDGLLVSLSPILLPKSNSDSRNFGILIIHYDLKLNLEKTSSNTLQAILSYSLIFILIALLMTVFFHFWVSRRTYRIINAIEKFNQGHKEARANLYGVDELSVIAEGLNNLFENVNMGRERLQKKAHELEQANKMLTLAKIAAENANRSKSEFIANISHEIRTPMNAVIGITDVLSDTNLNLEQKDYIRSIQKAGKSLLSMVNDVLDISKVEAGKMSLDKEPCSLSEIIEETIKLFSTRASEKNIVLRFYKSELVGDYVLSDANRIKQILLNLISNAIKFTNKGMVKVELIENRDKERSGNFLFKVSDTGVGIPTAALSKIFKPFSQADSSVTRKFGGTGLGLTIAQSLIHLMGGEIWVESQEGQGATFYFTLDLEPVTPTLAVKNDSDFHPTIVGFGEESFFNKVKDFFTPWGMPFVYLESISELNKLEKQIILFYFSDGITNHLKQLEQIQFKEKNIYIAISPYYDSSDKLKAIDLGFNDYLMCVADPKKIFLFLDKISAVIEDRFKKAEKQPSELITSKANKKILIVDDTEENRVLIKAYLRSLPVDIFESENGVEAFNRIQKENFDLVIMDVQMPIMDGYTALKKIRDWESEFGKPLTPIVILTAHATLEEEQKAFSNGCNAFLTKPIKKSMLIDVINNNSNTIKT